MLFSVYRSPRRGFSSLPHIQGGKCRPRYSVLCGAAFDAVDGVNLEIVLNLQKDGEVQYPSSTANRFFPDTQCYNAAPGSPSGGWRTG